MKVTVENFQSIKKAEIEVEGFTVITGANNSGKTALMRAIKGAFQNTPGTAFVRHGEDRCRVEVEFEDGSFAWEKGKGKPTYEIDGKVINPGKTVPDEVSALGVRPIKAGPAGDVWPQIAPQFTGQVFLVDKQGSALAEAVADVERVGKLNRALKAAESDKRSANNTAKVRKADLVTDLTQLESFEGLDEVSALVEKLEQDADRASKIGRAVRGLSDLGDRLKKAKAVVQSLDGVDVIEVVDRDEVKTVGVLGQECRAAEVLQEALQAAQEALQAAAGIAEALDTVPEDFASLEHLAEGLATDLGDKETLRDEYVRARQNLTDLETELGALMAEHAEVAGQAAEILDGLGQCPTCGSVVTGKAHHHSEASP